MVIVRLLQGRLSGRNPNVVGQRTADSVQGVNARMRQVQTSKFIVHVDVGNESNNVARRGVHVAVETKLGSATRATYSHGIGRVQRVRWEGLVGPKEQFVIAIDLRVLWRLAVGGGIADASYAQAGERGAI